MIRHGCGVCTVMLCLSVLGCEGPKGSLLPYSVYVSVTVSVFVPISFSFVLWVCPPSSVHDLTSVWSDMIVTHPAAEKKKKKQNTDMLCSMHTCPVLSCLSLRCCLSWRDCPPLPVCLPACNASDPGPASSVPMISPT